MLRLIWNILLITLCLGGNAKAHPHVFVDAHTYFIFNDQNQLQALRISWTYDEFTTMTMFEILDLDKDRDGKLNDADRTAIIEGETDWDPDYKGDIYLEIAGKIHPLGRPERAAAKMHDNRMEVAFNLQLSPPVDITQTPAKLRMYDPFYYYAYSIISTVGVGKMPENCSARIKQFSPSAADAALQKQLAALSREDTPEQDNVGKQFSDMVTLKCD